MNMQQTTNKNLKHVIHQPAHPIAKTKRRLNKDTMAMNGRRSSTNTGESEAVDLDG